MASPGEDVLVVDLLLCCSTDGLVCHVISPQPWSWRPCRTKGIRGEDMLIVAPLVFLLLLQMYRINNHVHTHSEYIDCALITLGVCFHI